MQRGRGQLLESLDKESNGGAEESSPYFVDLEGYDTGKAARAQLAEQLLQLMAPEVQAAWRNAFGDRVVHCIVALPEALKARVLPFAASRGVLQGLFGTSVTASGRFRFDGDDSAARARAFGLQLGTQALHTVQGSGAHEDADCYSLSCALAPLLNAHLGAPIGSRQQERLLLWDPVGKERTRRGQGWGWGDFSTICGTKLPVSVLVQGLLFGAQAAAEWAGLDGAMVAEELACAPSMQALLRAPVIFSGFADKSEHHMKDRGGVHLHCGVAHVMCARLQETAMGIPPTAMSGEGGVQ